MKYVQILLFALASTLFSTNADSNKKGNNNNNKITICHIPPGNPANMHQITISVNALQAHLDHGDIICGTPD
ncbi:hypothetical protein [Olleya aquimaris]|uniref:Uncharacterized protein n=1 Tax=Olleya aquimaris TaxID=639310 RepID=A0A327RJP1_9FLAO|nr:hypothetical protein [Olleya aquimaris]RAJ16202.1 hypothetical protein LY08_01057 [Olleya aquimaris]